MHSKQEGAGAVRGFMSHPLTLGKASTHGIIPKNTKGSTRTNTTMKPVMRLLDRGLEVTGGVDMLLFVPKCRSSQLLRFGMVPRRVCIYMVG